MGRKVRYCLDDPAPIFTVSICGLFAEYRNYTARYTITNSSGVSEYQPLDKDSDMI
jgi:hypothetical protein